LFNEAEFTTELRKEENSEFETPSVTMLLEVQLDVYEFCMVPQNTANIIVCCPRSALEDPFSTSAIIGVEVQ
jgi:hypothetical protein